MEYYAEIVLNAENSPAIHPLELSSYIIGRLNPLSQDNFILVFNSFISKSHCTLVLLPPDSENKNSYYVIFDGLLQGEKSANGTWINGKKISKNVRLNHEDEITFGSIGGYPKVIFKIKYPEDIDLGTFSQEFYDPEAIK